MMHSNAANRLDRLPISRFHKITLVAVSLAYFFEFADINSFATTVPKLIKLWGVSINQIAYVTSASFIGMFFGSLIASWLADRWGRKKALVITTLWFSAFSFAAVFSWDIVSLGVFRVLTSAGLSAMTVVAVIYVNEMFPAAKRGKFQAYAIVIGICGTPATNLIASMVVPLADWTWRLVYLWGALGILFILFTGHLKESPRWYESKGEFAKAAAILDEIEARVTAEKGLLPEPAAPVEAPAAVKAPLKLLLQKRYLAPTALLTVLWVTQTIGFFGYSSWAPTLLAKEGFSVENSLFYVALTTVGAPLGSYLASLVTDRFERKWCLVAFGSVIAVCGLFYGLTFNPVLIVVFGFLVNLFERGYTALGYAYSPELFDTTGRSMGTGISYGLGRLSNAAGPLIIAALYNSSGYQSVFIFIAGTWLFGAALLAIFGPKTRQVRLAAAQATAAAPIDGAAADADAVQPGRRG
ncbi:putative major facilitator superfamily transporter [Arthrobacter globiformis NBRC 12137]|jgi:putative MFS transporter|uniref:Putative major facilitator superfamily transporter n=1 Tax=Arthrobacter globiformis (strain ATCC 8010 / DSM 20124 / JCM 1332 / NBRC 12137 / NCIMB 8907 / NRRL B-2979 / 168) TaxID=1077972 RepID=H0QNJ3_ARTG1|nr:MFS transporter [Arthrobacter globiformis]GAB14394.1 putative major facilitator superfamily transporter [Arthrobacter globiformis NBRC 12137]